MSLRHVCKPDGYQWQKWFAWYPVQSRMERQGTCICHYSMFWVWCERKLDYWGDYEYRPEGMTP